MCKIGNPIFKMAITVKTKRRLILYLALAAIIGFLGAITIAYRSQDELRNLKLQTDSYPRSSPRYSMTGFTYTGTHEGKKVIWFHADRLEIDKQKIGFLNFNLLNRVRFLNADIKIFGQPRTFTAADGEGGGQVVQSDLTFENSFTRESMPSLPLKRVASIEFNPITVELYNGDQMLTRISAGKAKVLIRKQTIRFEGGVHVESGDRRLRTDKLSLMPGEEKVEIKSRYILKTQGAEINGSGLTTDFFLNTGSLEG